MAGDTFPSPGDASPGATSSDGARRDGERRFAGSGQSFALIQRPIDEPLVDEGKREDRKSPRSSPKTTCPILPGSKHQSARGGSMVVKASEDGQNRTKRSVIRPRANALAQHTDATFLTSVGCITKRPAKVPARQHRACLVSFAYGANRQRTSDPEPCTRYVTRERAHFREPRCSEVRSHG